PVKKGGLGLLDARTQTLPLQHRWLLSIFSPSPSPRFCSQLLHHHLRLIPNNDIGYRLLFFYRPLQA
ncbi:hypothetical protein BC941DRAFT_362472, partial [Chlamydoabsidia padenii]